MTHSDTAEAGKKEKYEAEIKLLNGYAKVLKQLARELPKHGADQSFRDTLSGIGSKLLFTAVTLPYRQ